MKKKMLITLLFFGIIFTMNVNAKSSYSCNNEVSVGEKITCKITVDTDPVMIESDGNIKIASLSGNSYTKLNVNQAVFYESGTVNFGPAEDKYSKYIISLKDKSGTASYASDIRVGVIAKTTAKSTTSTTNTTKKKSSNNYLSTLTIDGKELNFFSKEETKYYISVSYDVEKIVIKATPEDDTATVNITGPTSLLEGDNEYTIGVTSEDNTTKFYKLIVTRNEKEASSDTNIDKITISGYKFSYDGKSKTSYLTIKNDTKKLDIKVVTSDENATYEISGNKNLEDGSVIKIKVIAANGDTDLYRIIITKNSKKTILPYIIISFSIIIIIIVSIILIIRKKKNNKKDKKLPNKSEEIEKTIEFNQVTQKNSNLSIDNDEEEKTRIISYEEQEELGKTKVINLNDEDNSDDF